MPTRRDFLRGLIAAAALTQVPLPPVEAAIQGHIGSYEGVILREMGCAIAVNSGDLGEAAELLTEHARKHLPAGTVFELRMSLPGDLGRSRSMSWYSNNFMQEEPLNEWWNYSEQLGVYQQRHRA